MPTPIPLAHLGSRRIRTLVVLTAFLDESEHRDEGIFAIGGYVMSADACPEFEARWAAALAEASPPLDRFHMSEAENRQGAFAAWENDDRYDMLDQLIGIIRATTLFPVGAAVDLRAFEALSADDRAVLRNATPYTIAVIGLVRKIARQLGPSERVMYVLDRVPSGRGQARLTKEFDALRADPGLLGASDAGVAGVAWVSSREALELQAADIAAYEIAKSAMRAFKRTGRERRLSGDLLFRGLTPPGLIDYVLTEERLLRTIARVRGGGGLAP